MSQQAFSDPPTLNPSPLKETISNGSKGGLIGCHHSSPIGICHFEMVYIGYGFDMHLKIWLSRCWMPKNIRVVWFNFCLVHNGGLVWCPTLSQHPCSIPVYRKKYGIKKCNLFQIPCGSSQSSFVHVIISKFLNINVFLCVRDPNSALIQTHFFRWEGKCVFQKGDEPNWSQISPPPQFARCWFYPGGVVILSAESAPNVPYQLIHGEAFILETCLGLQFRVWILNL